MGMHCVTLSATSGYLFWQRIFFSLPFFSRESPFPIKKVLCRMLSLQGGLVATPLWCYIPTHPRGQPRPNVPSSPKQKFTGGIQLVNLTFGTLPAVRSTGREPQSGKGDGEWGYWLCAPDRHQWDIWLPLCTVIGYRALQQPAGSNRPHDAQAHAAQPVITAFGMVWVKGCMSSKTETGFAVNFPLFKELNFFFLSALYDWWIT